MVRPGQAKMVAAMMTFFAIAAAWSIWRGSGVEKQDRKAVMISPGSRPSTLGRTEDASGLVGGRGGTGPIVERGGGLLVGFSVTMMNWSGHEVIKSLAGIYRDEHGVRTVGKRFGHVSRNGIEVEAKEGYAVGAMEVKSGDRVNGFSITFMKVVGGKLDPSDSYESEWIGGSGGAGPVKMGGDGRAVVGIKVRYGNDLDAMTIVQ